MIKFKEVEWGEFIGESEDIHRIFVYPYAVLNGPTSYQVTLENFSNLQMTVKEFQSKTDARNFAISLAILLNGGN